MASSECRYAVVSCEYFVCAYVQLYGIAYLRRDNRLSNRKGGTAQWSFMPHSPNTIVRPNLCTWRTGAQVGRHEFMSLPQVIRIKERSGAEKKNRCVTLLPTDETPVLLELRRPFPLLLCMPFNQL